MKNNIVYSILILTTMLAITSCGKKADSKETVKSINPLCAESSAPFGAPDFSLYKTSDYMPAFEQAIAEKRAEINKIIECTDAPTYANTIDALELSGRLLDKVGSIFFTLNESDSNDEMLSIENNISPKLTELGGYIYMNDTLFNRIRTLYDNRANLGLTEEQSIVLENYYKEFVRGGALLDKKEKRLLLDINTQLGLESIKFGSNLLADSKEFQMIITNEKELSGLPESVRQSAKEAAKEANVEGWLFTLDKPSCIPFLQYADNRSLREKIYKAYYNRGNNPNQYNNVSTIRQILKLRQQKATMLGFDTYADFKMDVKMAKTPEAATKLMEAIWEAAIKRAKQEAAELQKMIDSEGGNFKLEGWDWMYYTEKLRKAKYSLDENEIKPYFQLENVRDGAFECATKLFGLSFVPRTDIPIYNDSVKVFQVLDEEKNHLGIFYGDYFPRKSKRSGAWMTNFVNQLELGEYNVRPMIVNVCNFTPASGDTPSLLNIDETLTLFHEFGHALHGMMTKAHYPSVSGTNVKHDFVELFSQIYEHWAMEPEVLKRYAKHYKTGETIPDALIEKIKRASHFNSGFETTELVAAALLDMKMHSLTDYTDFDCNEFEKQLREEIGFIPQIEYRYRTCNFAHIFNSGYSVGYYAYLWAEVLDADAFELFKERGIFDATTAKAFQHLLEMGGSEDPMTQYRKFRGADPNPQALLRSRGLID